MADPMTPAEEIARQLFPCSCWAPDDPPDWADGGGRLVGGIHYAACPAHHCGKVATALRAIEQSALRQAAEVARAHAREFSELARDTGYTTQDEAAQIAECNGIAEEIEALIVGDNTSAKLAELAALTENWDSYGGRPINRDVLSLVELLLTEPAQAVPGSDGSVQLEWHDKVWDVEIRFAETRDGGVGLCDWCVSRVGGPEHSSDD